jgi:hypothetical protein
MLIPYLVEKPFWSCKNKLEKLDRIFIGHKTLWRSSSRASRTGQIPLYHAYLSRNICRTNLVFQFFPIFRCTVNDTRS